MSQIDEALISKWDSLISEGNIKEVLEVVKEWPVDQVPRGQIVPFCQILRRVGLALRGLELLQPHVKDKKLLTTANESEIIEYCTLLSIVGFTEEATERLQQLENQESADYQRAMWFAYICQWNYSQAIEWLDRYLNQTELTQYERAIAVTNKVAALLTQGKTEGLEVMLDRHFEICRVQGWHRLAINSLGLMYQFAVTQRNWDYIQKIEDRCQQLNITKESQDYRTFVKWQLIAKGLQERKIDELMEFRDQCVLKKDWETVRIVDVYRVKIQYDQRTLDRLWFGTPFEHFRNKLKFEYPTISPHFETQPGAPLLVDLQGENPQWDLKPGNQTHLLLCALLSEQYRPVSRAFLYKRLFADDFFDPQQFDKKIHVIVDRTRKWLKDNEIDAQIALADNGYQIQSESVNFRLSPHSLNPYPVVQLEKWKEMLKASTFQKKDIKSQTDLSESSIQRILKYGVEKEILEKFGEGRGTGYRFR